MISRETLAAYNASRPDGTNAAVICHAPFLNLNFEQNGNVTACCYNRKFILGSYPKDTVQEIWTGLKSRELRTAFLENREVPTCALCFHQVQSGNFSGALMRNFDRFATDAAYTPGLDMPAPLVLEFEISNTCNLECIMCGGHWSSSIRARRDHLPPLRSPYDKEFVRQLEPYLKSVVQARFLGGEPFLIRRYYDIWETLARVNPAAQVAITTNATFLPERARAAIEDLRADIIVSLDAVTKDTYESIRRNAVFEEVMENVEYLLAYTRRKDRSLTLAVCPMQQNWRELDRLLRFCDDRQIQLHFNTVIRPREASIGGLPEDALQEVIAGVQGVRPTGQEWWQAHNRAEVDGLLNQLQEWMEHKRAFGRRWRQLATTLLSGSAAHIPVGFNTPALGRAIQGLALAWQWDSEQDSLEPWELRNLLPAVPMALWEGSDSVEHADLALGALILAHGVPPAAGADDGTRAAIEAALAATVGNLDEASRSGASAARIAAFGEQVREHARMGRGLSIVRDVHEAFAAAGGLADPRAQGGIDGRLDDAWASLRFGHVSEDARARVRCYLDDIVTAISPILPGSVAPPARDGVHATTPIRDIDDFRAALAAAWVWRAVTQPGSDLAALAHRLVRCHDAVLHAAPGSAAAVFKSIDVNRVLRFVAGTSDAEFERVLRETA